MLNARDFSGAFESRGAMESPLHLKPDRIVEPGPQVAGDPSGLARATIYDAPALHSNFSYDVPVSPYFR